jgi:hypothetical protein
MHYIKHKNLKQATFRLPGWMHAHFETIQKQNCYPSKTEAVRRVLIAGFLSMGIDLPSVEE